MGREVRSGGAHLSSEQLRNGGRRIAPSWRPAWGDPPVSKISKQNSGEIKWLGLEPSTPEKQKPLRGLRDKLNGGRKLL